MAPSCPLCYGEIGGERMKVIVTWCWKAEMKHSNNIQDLKQLEYGYTHWACHTCYYKYGHRTVEEAHGDGREYICPFCKDKSSFIEYWKLVEKDGKQQFELQGQYGLYD